MNFSFIDGNKKGSEDIAERVHSPDIHTIDSSKCTDSFLEVEGSLGELMPPDLTERKCYSLKWE